MPIRIGLSDFGTNFSAFWIPLRTGPLADLEPVAARDIFPRRKPSRDANLRKSLVGADNKYIVASSIAERTPRRGNKVKIDHVSTNFLENEPCVAPPSALTMFFLDLISQTVEPIVS